MNGCSPCEGYDSMMTTDEKAWRQEELKREREALNREVTIDGVKLQVRDIFPSTWDAQNFVKQLNLINKAQGDKVDAPAVINSDDAVAELLGGPDATSDE